MSTAPKRSNPIGGAYFEYFAQLLVVIVCWLCQRGPVVLLCELYLTLLRQGFRRFCFQVNCCLCLVQISFPGLDGNDGMIIRMFQVICC